MKKVPARNQRRASRTQRRQQNLLEVNVRSAKASAQRNRRIVSFFCVFILIGAAVGGVYYGAREALRRFFWENADYQLSEVEIHTDGSLGRDQILAASGIREGGNIFAINISKARENLTQLPQVEIAEIQRLLPNKIAITVTERKPIAWIAAKYDEDPTVYASSFLVDGKGVLIKSKNQLSEYFHLPVIYGMPTAEFEAGQVISTPELKAALDLVRLNSDIAAQARFQVRSIDLSKGYCMAVTDRNHAKITFGLERIDLQIDRLLKLLDQVDQLGREIQTVNLMVQRNVPVTFTPLPDPQAGEAQAEAKPAVAPVKKPEPSPKTFSAPKAKPAASARRAEPVHKPVRRATPVNSHHKTNG